MSRVRLPVAVELSDREEASRGLFRTDTLLINCYIEHEDGKLYVAKRPGLSLAYTYNGGAATNGQGTVYYNGCLFAIGSNVIYKVAGSLNTGADGTAWTASTSATWKGRGSFPSVVFNGQILIFGGVDATATDLNDVWASSDGINWRQLTASAAWGPRRNHCCVVLGNTIYLMGGIHSTTYGDVWSSTDGVNWVQVVGTANWPARSAFGAVPFNNGILLMGGRDTSGNLLNDVWFSPDGVTWTQLSLAASWSARQLFGCLVFNNKVWVAGGITGGGVVATVYSSIDGIVWNNTGSLPTNRRSMMTAVYAGKMWFVGGTDNAASTWAGVYSSADGVTFATPTSNYGGGVVAAGVCVPWTTSAGGTITVPTLYLIGGFIGGAVSTQVYKATLNVSVASSYSPATGTTTTDQWQTETQNAGQYLILKNTVDAWIFYAGVLQKITSSNYPTATVPGVANLDDTLYVMDSNGVIYGSNLSDPFTWSANNFITADFHADTGIYLAKYQQYIVALKSQSIQFFYDAGRYPGSPLLPVLSGNQLIGCVSAGSVVNMDNTIVFMATTGASDRFIAVLNGTAVQKISTPSIDRILFSWTPDAFCYAENVKTNGHDFYIVTLKTSGVSLAYDFVEQRWHIWQSSTTTGNYFTGVNFVSDGTYGYLQDLTLGAVYRLDEVAYSDGVGGSAQTINVSITLSKYDNGSNKRKFCTSATIIGDRGGGASVPNTATLQWSDDDEKTFNTGFTVDLTTENPTVNRLGSFYRRVFRITHAVDNPMRLEALELDMAEGY